MTGTSTCEAICSCRQNKNPEYTYTHLIVRQAKTEMPESKTSCVHCLHITGCQKSYK